MVRRSPDLRHKLVSTTCYPTVPGYTLHGRPAALDQLRMTTLAEVKWVQDSM